MKTFIIQPLVGVEQIHLGASRAEVLRILGPSVTFKKSKSSLHSTDAWFNNGFQVFYSGEDPTVEYIELSRETGFDVQLFGHSVFATEASQLVSLIEEHASVDKKDPEHGYGYIFPALELSFWRPVIESPEGSIFSSVGIGVHGYFSN